MPIFTFKCETCGAEREIVCKVTDRESLAERCGAITAVGEEDDDYTVCAGSVRWTGRVEGGQAHRADGSYKFAVIDQHGKRHVSPAAESKAAKGGLR